MSARQEMASGEGEPAEGRTGKAPAAKAAEVAKQEKSGEALSGATSSTPQSSSSTPSTGSSTNPSGTWNGSSKPGKFKEKRPEPLDLSVKSATSVPSGGFGNLFNINSMMTTLETPRIVWQDSESLMSKHARLYSSSNSANNARLKLSSIAGDSPPITPGTPYMDQLMMFASSNSMAAAAAAGCGQSSPTNLVCRSAGYANPFFSHYFNQKTPVQAQQQQPQHQAQPHSAKSFFQLGGRAEGSSPLRALISAQRQFNHWQQMMEQTGESGSARGRQASSANSSPPTSAGAPGSQSGSKSAGSSSFQKQMLAAYLKRANQSGSSNKRELAHLNSAGSEPDKPSVRKSCSSDDLSAGNHLELRHSSRANHASCAQDKMAGGWLSPLASRKPLPAASVGSGEQEAGAGLAANSTGKRLSPVINVSGESSSSLEASSQSIAPAQQQQAPTPASLVNATENLLNIHLNSPTGSTCSSASLAPMFSGAHANEISPALPPSLGDFLAGSAQESLLALPYNQQQQPAATLRGQPSAAPSCSSGERTPAGSQHSEKSPFSQLNYIQHQGSLHQQLQQSMAGNGLGSLSSCATLNTPTLISPSQFKGGSICFLPSPTLSPMSSVFELPSPLLMFPPAQLASVSPTGTERAAIPASDPNPAATNTGQPSKRLATEVKLAAGELSKPSAQEAAPGSARTASDNALSSIESQLQPAGGIRQNLSENSLVHLVTSARDKVGAAAVEQDEFKMEVDSQEGLGCFRGELPGGLEPLARPATVLPQIQVVSEQDSGLAWRRQESNTLEAWPSQRQSQSSLGQQVRLCVSAEDSSQAGAAARLREQVAKRALSQQNFGQAKPNLYQRDCSSGLPDVYQTRRPHSKLKSAVSGGALPDQLYGASSHPFPAAGAMASASMSPESHSMAGQRACSGLDHRGGYYAPAPAAELYHQQAADPQLAALSHYAHLGCPQHQPEADWLPADQQPGYLQEQQQQRAWQPAGLASVNCQPAGTQQQHYNFSHSVHHHHSSSSQLNSSAHHFEGPISHEHFKASSASRLAAKPSAGSLQEASLSAAELCRQPEAVGVASGANQLALGGQGSLQAPATSSLSQLDQLIQHREQELPLLPVSSNQQQLLARSVLEQRTQSADRQLSSAGHNFGRAASGGEQYRSASACCVLGGGAAPSGAKAGPPGSQAKKYHCDQCLKAFTRSDMLTRHKRLHSGDRPFQCNECKQEFNRSDHLSTHMRTHTGEKPYKCKLCTYSACRKDMITRHMKVHNRSSPSASSGQLNLRLARR